MGNTTTSPLSAEQLEYFSQFSSSLTRLQLAWVAGYLAGLSAQEGNQTDQQAVKDTRLLDGQIPLTVLYGSRTGNGEGLAGHAQKLAIEHGLSVSLKNMANYKPRDLHSEKNLLVIVSTHGEGDPPFDAKELHDFIFSKRAPKLEGVNFAVLGLGDSAYFHFCKTGRDFDSQLEKLGAKRLSEFGTLDVDFRDAAELWLKSTISAFVTTTGATLPSIEFNNQFHKKENNNVSQQLKFTKNRPYSATVFEKISLHGRGSGRQTLHIELNANTIGLEFESGDAAGVIPANNSVLIDEVLESAKLGAQTEVEANGRKKSIYEALHHDFELSKITTDVVNRHLSITGNEKLQKLTESPDLFKQYLYGHDIVDLLRDFPVTLDAAGLIKLLRPIQPRYYSIASSPVACPGEIHLTVGVVKYEHNGRTKRGTCSNFLSDVASEDEMVNIFIEANPNFKLPKSSETPIIMVGAGTGIAPYRAFVQHRELDEKPGKSWLIFGNRNFETEFLYQTEWQNFLKSGALTRMDVAFSRDSEKKVYVQHKILENGKEIFKWIDSGAHFYICGDMKKMATDVQNALVSIVEKHGAMNKESALEYTSNLQKERRLQLDVY